MAEKFITSRVKQRFDTLSEWQAIWETFKPLKGEICKIQIPANTEVTGLRTSSSVRVMTKTGDGETTLALLPWDSAIGADETQLSKGTDKTASKSLSHGGTFTAITETSVSGHKVTDTTTTYTLPAETAIATDQLTGTQLTPSHGGTFNVVTAVAKGDTSHNVDVTTTSVKLPAETKLSKGTDATAADFERERASIEEELRALSGVDTLGDMEDLREAVIEVLCNKFINNSGDVLSDVHIWDWRFR